MNTYDDNGCKYPYYVFDEIVIAPIGDPNSSYTKQFYLPEGFNADNTMLISFMVNGEYTNPEDYSVAITSDDNNTSQDYLQLSMPCSQSSDLNSIQVKILIKMVN